MINNFRYRIFGDNNIENLYKILISQMIQLRNKYFIKTKTNIFSDTMFKDFILDCIGPDINPDHQILIKYEKRRLNNKPTMYIYDPNKQRKEEKDNFFFRNLSGNEIKNNKHLRLNKKINDNADDDTDGEEIINDNNDNNDNNDDVDENIDDIDDID